jgi:hypothetical protein
MLGKANETRLHHNNMNREDFFNVVCLWEPLMCYQKRHRKPISGNYLVMFSNVPRRPMHTVLIMTSPDTHQRPPAPVSAPLIPFWVFIAHVYDVSPTFYDSLPTSHLRGLFPCSPTTGHPALFCDMVQSSFSCVTLVLCESQWEQKVWLPHSILSVYYSKFSCITCSVVFLLHSGLLLGLLFNPQDGGDMFLRNVGLLSPGRTALYPRDITFCGTIIYSISSNKMLH